LRPFAGIRRAPDNLRRTADTTYYFYENGIAKLLIRWQKCINVAGNSLCRKIIFLYIFILVQ
ncbi:hypothetical protein ALC60_03287, partial [Trachymyrmex zeteki]